MSKIGRNALCPCGSGKKYKKCCLSSDQQLQSAKVAEANRARTPAIPTPWPQPLGFALDDDLDELSNSVVDLIEQGRLDVADEVCDRLRREYPDVVDGLWRQAMVCAARGHNAGAAKYYRQSADFARTEGGFDEEAINEWRERADELEKRTARTIDDAATARRPHHHELETLRLGEGTAPSITAFAIKQMDHGDRWIPQIGCAVTTCASHHRSPKNVW